MRNLKRALSLALASVMLLGMMVVGTSAVSYPDIDENDNVEAIEVLNAVNVMIGRQGNFEPDEAVNRHEMAVIMAKLVLGVDTADNYVGSHPFTDVVPWADRYVAACYENGLIAGTSATTYGGSQPLTAVQAAAMMLRALGYKDLSVGATDWRAPVTAMANQIRLFNGVASNPSQQLNRNQVAQLALNTLKSPMVNLVDNTITWNSNEGQVVMASGGRQYIALSSREAYARAINRVESAGTSASQIGGWTVELGEHLYNGDLKLNDVTDPFQRPARQWEYDGKEIGTYIKEELLDFEKVGEVTGKDLYDVLGKTAIDEYTMIVALDGVTDPDIVYQVNGYDGNKDNLGAKHNQHYVFDASDLNRSNKGSVGGTGTGVLTQVFVDPNYDNGGSAKDGRIWIAVINTYLARATQDYDTRREELALNAYSVRENRDEYVALPKDGSYETVRLGVEEYPVVKDADKDDAFLVTFAEGEVQTIVPAEVMEAVTISSFKSKDNLVVDGTKYSFTTTAGFDADALKNYTGGNVTNLKDITYNVFLDAYGNTIGVQEVDAKKNYVFLAAIDINDSNLVNGTANAKAVFLDGTVDTIRVNLDKSTLDWYKNGDKPGGYNKNSILNTWCTYTVNNSSVYTVKQVADVSANGDTYVPGGANNGTDLAQYHQTGFTNDYKIDKKHITLNGKAGTGSFARVYGNEDTVYLNAELGNLTNDGGKWGVIKDVDTVTVAAENVNLTVWTDAQAQTEAENSSSPSVALSGNEYATKGVYTLYDDDGIVIAAVVVGEDEGSARNLVYVHSGSIESESYNGSSSSRAAGDGMWTWTRKVIQNGEEVTLTEVSDGNSDLDKMQQYHWYQIKTNADGEVTGVYRLDQDNRTTGDWATTAKHRSLPAANLDRYDDYALSYLPYTDDKGVTLGEIAYTVQNGASTVLYWNENLINSRLRMDGRTLYVATNDQTGFIVNSNVKWVVQQWDNNKRETYIDDGTTASGLKSMIDEVNRRYTNGQNYTYQVSAVIESGIASSVVIYFNENDYNRPSTPVVDTGMLKWDRATETWTLTVPAGVDVDALTTTQVRDYLIEAGCTDIVKTRDGWTFTLDGTEYENQIVKVEAKAGAVAVTGVTLDKTTASVKVGETVTLTATVAPADAANKNVTWSSSDTSVATVSGGVVSGVGAGTAKITVTTADGGKTAECNVTVTVPGDGYAVTVKGTALEDNHYSADLPAGGEVTKGESFTITALKKIVVYDETGRTVVKKGETYDVTPTKDITVVINRTKLERGENNTMVEVEDTNADTPAAGGVAIMAMFARAAARVAEPDYQRLIITDADGKDHEYIVKVVTGEDGMSTIYFPSAESVAEAVEILNAADLANKGGDMDLVDDATDEEIEESWGSENPVTVDGLKVVYDGDAAKYVVSTYAGEAADQTKVLDAVLAEYNKRVEGGTATFSDVKYDAATGNVTFKATNNGATEDKTLSITSGTAANTGSIEAPKALYKVTVGTASPVYVAAGEKITTVTKGTYISDANVYVASGDVTTKASTADDTGLEFKAAMAAEDSYDVTLIQAVAATGTMAVGTSAGQISVQAKVSYNGTSKDITDLAAASLVPVGSDLTLFVYVSAKSSATYLVNDTTRITVKNDTNAVTFVQLGTSPIKVALKDDAFTIEAATDFQIKINGVVQTDPSDNDTYFTAAPSSLTLSGSGWEGLSLAPVAKEGLTVFETSVTPAAVTIAPLGATVDLSGFSPSGGVLELWSGYKIGAPTTGYSISNAQTSTSTGAVSMTNSNSNGGFVTCKPGATPVTLYVTAPSATVVKQKLTGGTEKIASFAVVTAPEYAQVDSAAATKDVKGVYSFTAKGDVTFATEFECITYTAPTVSSYTKGATVTLADATSTKFTAAEITYTYAPLTTGGKFTAVTTPTAFGGTIDNLSVTLDGDDDTSSASAKCGDMTITAEHGGIKFTINLPINTTGS